MISKKWKLSVVMLMGILILSTAYADGNGKHAGHGGHMDHMMKVQNMLKKELGGSYNASIKKATPKELIQGKEIYQKQCAACHGLQGKGDGPLVSALPSKPADFTDPIHSKFYSDRARIYIIKKGIPGTAMAGMEKTLGNKEIRSVYLYIKSLRKCSGSEEDHN